MKVSGVIGNMQQGGAWHRTRGGRSGLAGVVALGLLLGGLATPAATFAGDQTVKWSDVRGIPMPGAVVGTGAGAVSGGGAPWSTTEGSVEVNLDKGKIKFEVHGLVLGTGNSIGTRDGIAMVKGTLVCDTNGSASTPASSVLVDTVLVPLNEQGDANFDSHDGAFNFPDECFSEPDIAFLIRTGGGSWIAFGAVPRP